MGIMLIPWRIHACIDYEIPDVEDSLRAESFGEIRINRNYLLFGLLRAYSNDVIPNDVIPKGLPEVLSWQATLYVVDEAGEGDEHCVSREDADNWEKHAKELREKYPDSTILYGYTDEHKSNVWHPDWHSHSWLGVEELENKLDPVPEGWHLDASCLRNLPQSKVINPAS